MVLITRREFIRSAALVSAGALSTPVRHLPIANATDRYRPDLLPSVRTVWDWQVWMAGLGPKYTGNRGHHTFDGHPDIVRKAAGALCIEHLGCREWKDNSATEYRPTGSDELSLVMTNVASATDIVLAGVAGTADRRGVVLKTKDGFSGEGRFLASAGVPTIGYIPLPDYLVAAAPNGCIDKVSRRLMYGQIQAFAKIIHSMDALTATQLKG